MKQTHGKNEKRKKLTNQTNNFIRFSVANSFVYRLINMHAINTFKCINTCIPERGLRETKVETRGKKTIEQTFKIQ